ncbi:MAG: YlmH/Sll1252 family protein [Breznakia sp.]
MTNKDKTQKHTNIHYKGYEDFIARIEDYLQKIETQYKVFTPFLTMDKQVILKRYIGKKYVVSFFGGYEQAENKMACIAYEVCSSPYPMVCLKATYHKVYDMLTHQDVYGALMNIGLNRQQFGDIVVKDGFIYLYTTTQSKHIIINQLTKIKHCYVVFEESTDVVEKKQDFEYRVHYIVSFRLDVLVSCITHLARDKAKKIIQSGSVKVDHIPLVESNYICNNECILSIRGYGRFKVMYTMRKTRSNRFCVNIAKFK